ncbi:MAG: Spy/CpxP family protein refolding chaperone [Labilithrix sp.]|nr:Spy/CpxP family protein refolding chaperone [Labilithrix sp.]MCW5809511.1 Spy/CpxP family protein refolding chaperone [Labilithrix sp.]
MHPAFFSWWKHARRSEREGCGPHAHPGEAFFGGFGHHGGPPHGGGGPEGQFGVRRPLRFLAHKLDLSEEQTANLARILDELKTERAQAEVDQRRTIAAFADAIEAATFGEARATEGGDQRVETAKRLRDAVVKALAQIHALLDDDQRKRFAYLVRTGVLAL